MAEAMNAPIITKKAQCELQDDAMSAFSKIFTEVNMICEPLDVPVTKPRRVGRQKDSNKLETPEEFYKNEIFLPFLQNTVHALDEKFLKHADILEPFQQLLDTGSDASKISQSVQHLSEFYDLQSTGIPGEAILWYSIIKEKKPRNAIEALKLCRFTSYHASTANDNGNASCHNLLRRTIILIIKELENVFEKQHR